MTIKELASDKALVSELRKYFEIKLQQHAIDKVFGRMDTSGIADAKEVLEAVFDQLEIDYQPKPKIINLDNAR